MTEAREYCRLTCKRRRGATRGGAVCSVGGVCGLDGKSRVGSLWCFWSFGVGRSLICLARSLKIGCERAARCRMVNDRGMGVLPLNV
jgi:hypothetical protein